MSGVEGCGEAENGDLGVWAEQMRNERVKLHEYLMNPPEFSNLWIKRELYKIRKHPSKCSKDEIVDPACSKGANMEVWDFAAEDFFGLLYGWVVEKHGLEFAELHRERTVELSQQISRRFVMKIGNIKYYVGKIGPHVSFLSRDYMEVFASVGFPVVPTQRRAVKNAVEAAQANLYLGNEDTRSLLGPDVEDLIGKFVSSPENFVFPEISENLIEGDDEGEFQVLTVEDTIGEPNDYGTYRGKNRECRSYRRSDLEAQLRPFFDALITVGFHDILRRVTGYNRHTELDYEQVEKLISQACEKYKDISFLKPQHTTYGYDPTRSSEEWETMISENDGAVEFFREKFNETLPDSLKILFEDEEVTREFCYELMRHFHDVPEYEVDQTESLFSPAFGKLILKLAYLFLMKPECDRRLDFDRNGKLANFLGNLSDEQKQVLLGAIGLSFAKYQMGKKEEDVQFSRFDKTMTVFQEHLRYDKEGVFVESVSIAELMDKRRDLFQKYPEIQEQLLVYFYQLYRFYHETGYITDNRPENLVKYLLGYGEWALRTENIQINIFKKPDGSEYVRVVNNDPEDHFRSMPRGKRIPHPDEGLGIWGMGLVDKVAGPSVMKAIALMGDMVIAARGDIVGNKAQLDALDSFITYWGDVANAFIRNGEEGIDEVLRVLDSAVAESRRAIELTVKGRGKGANGAFSILQRKVSQAVGLGR